MGAEDVQGSLLGWKSIEYQSIKIRFDKIITDLSVDYSKEKQTKMT